MLALSLIFILFLSFPAFSMNHSVSALAKMPDEIKYQIAQYTISGGTIDQDETNCAYLALVNKSFREIANNARFDRDKRTSFHEKVSQYNIDQFVLSLLINADHQTVNREFNSHEVNTANTTHLFHAIGRLAREKICAEGSNLSDQATALALIKLTRFYYFKKQQETVSLSGISLPARPHNNDYEELLKANSVVLGLLGHFEQFCSSMNNLVKRRYTKTLELLLKSGYPSYAKSSLLQDWEGPDIMLMWDGIDEVDYLLADSSLREHFYLEYKIENKEETIRNELLRIRNLFKNYPQGLTYDRNKKSILKNRGCFTMRGNCTNSCTVL